MSIVTFGEKFIIFFMVCCVIPLLDRMTELPGSDDDIHEEAKEFETENLRKNLQYFSLLVIGLAIYLIRFKYVNQKKLLQIK